MPSSDSNKIPERPYIPNNPPVQSSSKKELSIENYSANKRATIERILRDKGMDTMQVQQALGMIEETLFDPLPVIQPTTDQSAKSTIIPPTPPVKP